VSTVASQIQGLLRGAANQTKEVASNSNSTAKAFESVIKHIQAIDSTLLNSQFSRTLKALTDPAVNSNTIRKLANDYRRQQVEVAQSAIDTSNSLSSLIEKVSATLGQNTTIDQLRLAVEQLGDVSSDVQNNLQTLVSQALTLKNEVSRTLAGDTTAAQIKNLADLSMVTFEAYQAQVERITGATTDSALETSQRFEELYNQIRLTPESEIRSLRQMLSGLNELQTDYQAEIARTGLAVTEFTSQADMVANVMQSTAESVNKLKEEISSANLGASVARDLKQATKVFDNSSHDLRRLVITARDASNELVSKVAANRFKQLGDIARDAITGLRSSLLMSMLGVVNEQVYSIQAGLSTFASNLTTRFDLIRQGIHASFVGGGPLLTTIEAITTLGRLNFAAGTAELTKGAIQATRMSMALGISGENAAKLVFFGKQARMSMVALGDTMATIRENTRLTAVEFGQFTSELGDAMMAMGNMGNYAAVLRSTLRIDDSLRHLTGQSGDYVNFIKRLSTTVDGMQMAMSLGMNPENLGNENEQQRFIQSLGSFVDRLITGQPMLQQMAVLESLSEKTGLSVISLRKLSEASANLSNQVETSITLDRRYANEMANLGKVTVTIRENFNKLLTGGLWPLAAAASGIARGVSWALEKLVSVPGIFETMAVAVGVVGVSAVVMFVKAVRGVVAWAPVAAMGIKALNDQLMRTGPLAAASAAMSTASATRNVATAAGPLSKAAGPVITGAATAMTSWSLFGSALMSKLSDIKAWFSKPIATAPIVTPPVAKTATAAARSAVPVVVDAASTTSWISSIRGALTTYMVNPLRGVFSSGVGLLSGAWSGLKGVLSTGLVDPLRGLASRFSSLASSMVGPLRGVLTSMSTSLSSLWTSFSGLLSRVSFDSLKSILASGATTLSQSLAPLKNLAASLASTLANSWSSLKGIFASLSFDSLKGALASSTSVLTRSLEPLRSLGSSLVGGLTSSWGALKGVLSSISFDSLKTGLASGASALARSLSPLRGAAASLAGTFASSLAGLRVLFASVSFDSLRSVLSSGASALTQSLNPLRNIASSLSNALASSWSALRGVFTSLSFDSLKGVLAGGSSMVTRSFTSLRGIMSTFSGVLANSWTTLKGLASTSLIEPLKSAFAGGASLLTKSFSSLKGLVSTDLLGTLKGLIPSRAATLAKGAADGLAKTVITPAATGLAGAGFFNTLRNFISTRLIDPIRGLFSSQAAKAAASAVGGAAAATAATATARATEAAAAASTVPGLLSRLGGLFSTYLIRPLSLVIVPLTKGIAMLLTPLGLALAAVTAAAAYFVKKDYDTIKTIRAVRVDIEEANRAQARVMFDRAKEAVTRTVDASVTTDKNATMAQKLDSLVFEMSGDKKITFRELEKFKNTSVKNMMDVQRVGGMFDSSTKPLTELSKKDLNRAIDEVTVLRLSNAIAAKVSKAQTRSEPITQVELEQLAVMRSVLRALEEQVMLKKTEISQEVEARKEAESKSTFNNMRTLRNPDPRSGMLF
jgi:hypothetical protein